MLRRVLAALAIAGVALSAQDYRAPAPSVVDDPALPRVLLIGDSISVGYTVPVRKLLAGKANVHRISVNGGPTTNGVHLMEEWLGKGRWDVIHFNFGLHDLKRLADGKQQVPPEAYERYLRLIVLRLKQTGAKLIWATITPVPEGKVSPPRVPSDVPLYNEIALRIMKENAITINDLYSFAKLRIGEIQEPLNVHFKPSGSELLAGEVVRHIEAALGTK